MSCLIPLAVLSKLEFLGVKPHKAYNDAKRKVIEKYGLTVTEEDDGKKAIRIENEDQLIAFFKYFTEELLGRSVTTTAVLPDGYVPLEKLEEYFKRFHDAELTAAKLEVELKKKNEMISKLESMLNTEKQEKEKILTDNKILQRELERLKEKIKQQELEQKIARIEKLIEQLPDEDKKILEELIEQLR